MKKKNWINKAFLSLVGIQVSVKIYRFVTKIVSKYVFTCPHVLFGSSFLPSPNLPLTVAPAELQNRRTAFLEVLESYVANLTCLSCQQKQMQGYQGTIKCWQRKGA